MLFVLDNSVSMRWLFKDGTEADLLYAEQVLEALKEGSAVVHGVWWLEVSNVIVRAEAQQLLPETQSRKFLDTLRKIPITVDSSPVEQLWEQTLHLARKFHVSAYDAAYLELAIRQNIVLATLDADLARAARQSKTQLF
jgi:predicted nucleic acid-binding protein